MIKRIAIALGAVLAASLAAVATEAPASAAVSQVTTLTNRADNGLGGTWARDNLTRTTTIEALDEGGEVYQVTFKDEGTFTTVQGAATPADAARTIARALPGTVSGTGTFVVTGELKKGSEIRALKTAYDDTNGAVITTGTWWKRYFKAGATTPGITQWGWSYKTADETMVESEANGYVGNITGKLASELKAANKCRVAPNDKRNVWTVSNVRGERVRNFKFWVKYNGVYSATQYGQVAPGKTVLITTPGGGRLTVLYYDGYGQQMRDYAWSKAAILC